MIPGLAVHEYFIRHGEFFTLVTDVEDPVYLTEPLIRTLNWVLDLAGRFPRILAAFPLQKSIIRTAMSPITCPGRTRR